MPHDSFLQQRSDFNALVETVADSVKINDPALVEKRLLDHVCRLWAQTAEGLIGCAGAFANGLKVLQSVVTLQNHS